MKYYIEDWAGNQIEFEGFETYDDAEEYLSEIIERLYPDDDWQACRDEYYIKRKETT